MFIYPINIYVIQWLVNPPYFCFQMNIISRDIKLENILVGEDGHLALSDFGLSIKLQSEDQRCFGDVGTFVYKAPEMLNHSINGYDKVGNGYSDAVSSDEVVIVTR